MNLQASICDLRICKGDHRYTSPFNITDRLAVNTNWSAHRKETAEVTEGSAPCSRHSVRDLNVLHEFKKFCIKIKVVYLQVNCRKKYIRQSVSGFQYF